jgi:hypothetical protein
MSLKRALAWAGAGWSVFPCRENKKPYFADWNEAATTNGETINSWWNSVPEAQVGVVPAMAGCFVLDVDVGAEKHGFESLEKLETAYNFKAEDYPNQSTPSGGKHYFFKGYAPTSAGVLGSGLDTRGGMADGTGFGYVVAYSEAAPVAAKDCPVGVVFQFAKRDRSASTADPLVEEDLDANIERAKAYLSGIEGVPEGSRGITLFKHAATLKDLGVGIDKALELFAEYPAALGNPPQDADEAYGRIASAYRNGQLQPGIAAINPDTIAALASEEKSKGFPKRKRLATWPELREKPEPPWVVRNLIPGNALVGMFGPGGSYKSFIAVDIALAIATYRLDWGGEDILTHGPIVVISGEGSQGPRVRAWEKANDNIKVGDTFAVLDGINLSDASDIVSAAAEIDQAVVEKWNGQKPVLLVVDTLARASGGADENSSKDMGAVVVACDELRRHFGCTVLLVHHTPKSGNDWRGSTAVYFALDAGLAVKRHSAGKVSLEVARMKDGAIGQKWDIKLDQVATGRDREGVAENSLVLSSVRPSLETPKDLKEQVQQFRDKALTAHRAEVARSILADLPEGNPISVATLAKQIGAMPEVGDVASLRTFLNQAVAKTADGKRLNTNHPLADHVFGLDPLSFGPVKEKASEVSPESLLPV